MHVEVDRISDVAQMERLTTEIESALHDVVAPATGRLAISAPTLAVIEPGFLLATLAVDTVAAAGA